MDENRRARLEVLSRARSNAMFELARGTYEELTSQRGTALFAMSSTLTEEEHNNALFALSLADKENRLRAEEQLRADRKAEQEHAIEKLISEQRLRRAEVCEQVRKAHASGDLFGESLELHGDINDELPDAPWHLQDGPPDVDQPWNWHEEIDPSDVDQPLDSESQPVGAAFQPFGPDTELVWPPQLTVWPTHWKQLTYRQRVEIKTLRDTANWKLSAIASAYNTTKATVSRTCKRPATPIKRGCPKRVIDTPIRKLLAARSALNADHRRMPFSKIARLEGVDASDMTLRSAFALEGIFRRTARKKPYLDTTQKANRLIFAIAYADWTVRCFRVCACAHVHVSTR